jgi:hypothetical protein
MDGMSRARQVPATLLGLATLLSLPAPAEPMELDAERLEWSSFALRARRMGMSFHVRVGAELVDAREAASGFVTRPEGLEPRGDELVLTTLETRGMGNQSTTRLWTEPDDAVALQRTQRDGGRRHRLRINRYERGGVLSIRRAPLAGEDTKPPEEWGEVSETESPFPDWAGDGLEVSEPSVLLYVLAVAELEEVGDRVQLPVFSRGELLLVDLLVTGTERSRVELAVTSGGETRDVREQVELVEILIDGSHLGPESEEGDFEFLGMRGDVTVLLHPEYRVPIEVSGRVPRAGRVRVRLRELELR